MRHGTDSKWVIHGREENMTIHDEGGMRHFYAEWGRRMGRPAYDPYGQFKGKSSVPGPSKLTPA
jgi:methanesulfonate monooxygenase large subunit